MSAKKKETPKRFSEKRLLEDFSVYLFFDDVLEFELQEIVDALAEDFPDLAHWCDLSLTPVPALNTDTLSFGVLKNTQDERMAKLITTPARFNANLEVPVRRAHSFREASTAISGHVTDLQLSMPSEGADLASRFVAARDLTCLAAVFAKLPICRAVYFPNGDAIVSPETWARAAETAMADEWPLTAWMSYEMGVAKQPNVGLGLASCASIGMAAFNGHEVQFAQAPLDVAEAGSWLMAAMWLLLAGGNTVTDGDTTGLEGSNLKVKLRHLEEGKGGKGFPQTDLWCLIHPSSPIDEQRIFGKPRNQPAPPGVDSAVMPRKNFLSRLIRRADRSSAD